MPQRLVLLPLAVFGMFQATGVWAEADRSARPVAASTSRELRAERPAFFELSRAHRQLVSDWLAIDCAVGFGVLEGRLRKAGAVLELSLVEAYRVGPPQSEIDRIAQEERANYVAFRERLDGPDRSILPDELRASLLAITEEQYVAEAVRRTIRGYRSAALNGLGLIGSERIIPWLERTLQTVPEPLATDMRRTLAQIRERARDRSKP